MTRYGDAVRHLGRVARLLAVHVGQHRRPQAGHAPPHRPAGRPPTPTATQVLGVAGRRPLLLGGPHVPRLRTGQLADVPVLAAGATAIVEPTRPPTPALVGEVVRALRPTLFFCIPTFYAALLASDLPDDTFESVRYGVSAAEPLPADIFNRFRDRFGVEILDGIGSTELTHIFISNRPGQIRPGTSGVAGARLRRGPARRRRRARGRPDVPGHLHVGGESMATGYWCAADSTRRSFQGRPDAHRRHVLAARPTATTPTSAAATTCSGSAANGSRRPRSRPP